MAVTVVLVCQRASEVRLDALPIGHEIARPRVYAEDFRRNRSLPLKIVYARFVRDNSIPSP